jgi:hypothetical protein
VSPPLNGVGFERKPTLRAVASSVEPAVVDRLAALVGPTRQQETAPGIVGVISAITGPTRSAQLLRHRAHVEARVEGRKTENTVTRIRARSY